jgi:hypothetical protein
MSAALPSHAPNQRTSDSTNEQGNVERKKCSVGVVQGTRLSVALEITNGTRYISRGRPIWSHYYIRHIHRATSGCNVREWRQELSHVHKARGLARRRSRPKRLLPPFKGIVPTKTIRIELERADIVLSPVETARGFSHNGALQRQFLVRGTQKHSQFRRRTNGRSDQPAEHITVWRSCAYWAFVSDRAVLERRNS